MAKETKNHSLWVFRILAAVVGAALIGVFIAPFHGGLDRRLDVVENISAPERNLDEGGSNASSGNNIVVEQFDYSEPESAQVAPEDVPTGEAAQQTPQDSLERESGPVPLDQAAQPDIQQQADISTALHVNEDAPMRLLPRPVAVAAGRLESRGQIIELEGIESLSIEETCQSATGENWPCGMLARTAFRQWLRQRTIMCRLPDNTAGEMMLTQCSVGNDDAALWLVNNGWAKAAPDGRYAEAGQKAQQDKRGIYGDRPNMALPEFNPDLPQQSVPDAQQAPLDTPVEVQPTPRLEGEFPPAPN